MAIPSQQLTALIRTTGGQAIGFGHVRRCLSLAGALRDPGIGCSFLLHGDAAVVELIRQSGFEAHLATADDRIGAETLARAHEAHAGAVVVDAYDLDAAYFRMLHQAGLPVAAIDDHAGREMAADLIVNGTPNAAALPYRALAGTRLLLGPQYMLLRPEFALDPHRRTRAAVQRLLITAGGSDPHRVTPRLIRAAQTALPDVAIDVVAGPLFADVGTLQKAAATAPERLSVHVDPADMRALMLRADLAISSGGQTLYELAATATPTIAIRVAENQTVNLEALAQAGTLLWAGDATDVTDADLEVRVSKALAELARDPALREAMATRGRALVDGRGASRVAAAIHDLISA
jgi:UDP-2,4-diacetamido-2,4,6-trideoxy-beta-L-altropyranose hydrolase